MSIASGIIEAIKPREVKGPKGMFTSISYKVGDDWISLVKGKDNEHILNNLIVGDNVEIDYVVNGNFKNGKSVKLLKNMSTPKAVTGSTALDKAANRDFRITYAGSRNTAIAFAKLALDAGAITLPKKTSDIEAALQAYVDQLTVEFANKAWNSEPGEVPVEVVSTEGEVDAEFQE